MGCIKVMRCDRRGDRRRECQDKTRQDKTRQALLFLCSSLVYLVPLLSFLSLDIYIYIYIYTRPLNPEPPKVSFSTWFDRRRRGAGEAGLGWVGLGSIESTDYIGGKSCEL